MSIGVSSGLQFEDEFQLLAHNLLNPIQSTPEENKRTSDAPTGSGGPSVSDPASDPGEYKVVMDLRGPDDPFTEGEKLYGARWGYGSPGPGKAPPVNENIKGRDKELTDRELTQMMFEKLTRQNKYNNEGGFVEGTPSADVIPIKPKDNK